MHQLLDLIKAHPTASAVLVLALVNVLFTPKTEERYAAMPVWLAKFLRATAALGPDVLGAWAAVKPASKPRGFASRAPLAAVTGVAILIAIAPACALFQKHAKTALDVAQVACIIANATMPDEQVAKACDVLDDLRPAMLDVLRSQRMAIAKRDAELAAHCHGDDAMGPEVKDAGHD